jgi:hypothetical protein
LKPRTISSRRESDEKTKEGYFESSTVSVVFAEEFCVCQAAREKFPDRHRRLPFGFGFCNTGVTKRAIRSSISLRLRPKRMREFWMRVPSERMRGDYVPQASLNGRQNGR